MDTKELLKKVRKIEIKTKGLSNQHFSGEYHSAFKGRGMAFSEVREYVAGDEVRTIDWNVTARFNAPFVKVFEEERELTVLLLVDISASGLYGTRQQLKRETIAELCAVLAFSAVSNHDRAGLLLFSDHVEHFIPPKKGKKHILRMIRELIHHQTAHSGTRIDEALKYVTKTTKKKSTVFILSDFMAPSFDEALKTTARKHDVIALKINDPSERELPSIGAIPFNDLETGETAWVNTSSERVRQQYRQSAEQKAVALRQLFRQANVDSAEISTDQDYVQPLMQLFKKRS